MFLLWVVLFFVLSVEIPLSFGGKVTSETENVGMTKFTRHKRSSRELDRALQYCLSSSKHVFTGRVNCRGSQRGSAITVSCSFSCPAGSRFTKTPAESYRCDHYTGRFYPSDIPKCTSDSSQYDCLNGGEWTYGGNSVGYFCKCPPDWKGPQCQYPASNCKPQSLLELGFNGRVNCRSSYGTSVQTYHCTLSCFQDDVFSFSPADYYSCDYSNGRFTPDRLPTCLPKSNERRCQNGGEWLYGGRDTGYFCRCPKDWKGPQCQYRASNCSPQTLIDMGFKGRVNCRSSYGNGQQTYSCQLSCLNGNELDRPAAEYYYCDYATGQFTPTTIPNCVYPDSEIIFPENL